MFPGATSSGWEQSPRSFNGSLWWWRCRYVTVAYIKDDDWWWHTYLSWIVTEFFRPLSLTVGLHRCHLLKIGFQSFHPWSTYFCSANFCVSKLQFFAGSPRWPRQWKLVVAPCQCQVGSNNHCKSSCKPFLTICWEAYQPNPVNNFTFKNSWFLEISFYEFLDISTTLLSSVSSGSTGETTSPMTSSKKIFLNLDFMMGI